MKISIKKLSRMGIIVDVDNDNIEFNVDNHGEISLDFYKSIGTVIKDRYDLLNDSDIDSIFDAIDEEVLKALIFKCIK